MIGRLQRQASLFGFAFFKELTRLQDPTLGQIDLLLEDPDLVAICSRALAGRRQRSLDFGRATIAPDRLLRCVVLKRQRLVVSRARRGVARQSPLSALHPLL